MGDYEELRRIAESSYAVYRVLCQKIFHCPRLAQWHELGADEQEALTEIVCHARAFSGLAPTKAAYETYIRMDEGYEKLSEAFRAHFSLYIHLVQVASRALSLYEGAAEERPQVRAEWQTNVIIDHATNPTQEWNSLKTQILEEDKKNEHHE